MKLQPPARSYLVAALERPWGLSLLVPLLAARVAWRFAEALLGREEFGLNFPHASWPLYGAYLLYCLALLSGLGGLWFLRRWGAQVLLIAAPLGVWLLLALGASRERMVFLGLFFAVLLVATIPLWRRWWPRRGSRSG